MDTLISSLLLCTLATTYFGTRGLIPKYTLDLKQSMCNKVNHRRLLAGCDFPQNSYFSAVRPAVHLQYNHCRSRKSIRGHIPMYRLLPVYNPFFSTGRISALLHFYNSKQRLTDRATLPLSLRFCFITWRRS